MRRGIAVGLVVLGCVIALSGSMALAADQTFVVNSQNDASDGTCNAAHCSLREAINAANAAPGHDTIVFNISGSGVHTILAVGSPPFITSPVTIDATTETDYAGVPRVELDGFGTGGANGLWFSVGSGTSVVRGLAINRWSPGITTQDGVTLSVEDSYIGVSAGDGVTPRANLSGIVFLGGSNHIVEGNLISANTQAGIRLHGISGATIQGNRIGTNAAGTAGVANNVGIEITPTTSNATGIVIGGSGTGQGNQISGNTTDGIKFWPSETRTVTGTTILGNLIGTTASGTAALANGGHGIQFLAGNSGQATDSVIGGTSAGQGNTIAFNGGDGVFISTAPPFPEYVRNAIRGNAIHSNGTTVQHLGIDLGGNGVTPNDALDADGGANDLQNFPQFTIQVNTTIAGELDSEPSQDYEIDVYSSPSCDTSGNGEGRAFVESLSVSTNASGHANFSTSETLPYPGGFLTATATDAAGNTSEFSACFDVATVPQEGPTFIVNTTEDAEPVDAGCSTADCTLREAMDAANLDVGANTIAFDIAGSEPYTITPATALPPILETLTIDGETEPQFLDSPVVEIDGTVVSGGLNGPYDGLRVEADNSVVRGLVVNRFSNGAGIVIESAGNSVEGSFVGTNVAGTAALPNFHGIEILGVNNTIGGAADDARNVISGNESENVVIDSDGASGNDVTGNYIGTNAAGLGPLGGDGISIRDGASDNTIGGNTPALGNVIAGNVGTGVEIFGSATAGNVVEFNLIGLGATGLDGPGNDGPGVEIVGPVAANTVRDNWISLNAHGVVLGGIDLGASAQVVELNRIGLSFVTEELLGNTGHGILIDGSSGTSSNNLISANIVADSGGAGVRVDAATGTANGNRITNNGIRDNGELGIDLADETDVSGVTENDPDDADDGANRFQNFPELTSVNVAAGETTFTGTLNSTAGRTFRIEYYRSGECDPSEFGEGQDPIAGNNVTTDAGGDVSFEHAFPFELEAGAVVTAIALDLTTQDTSEFSHCTDVTVAPSEMVYIVNSNADVSVDVGCTLADCTLREAILAANGDGTPSTIEFDLTDTNIVLAGPLPAITAPVTLDGTSQGPGTVSIDGSGAGLSVDGLVFSPGSVGSFAEEIWLHDFDSAGIRIRSSGNTVQGFQLWNVNEGIVLEDDAGGNVVGGSFAGGAGNVIWDFGSNGIALREVGAANEIAGNTIGIDGGGTPQTLSPGNGIFAQGAAGTIIGHNVGPGGLGLVTGDLGNVIVRTGTGIFFESDVTGSILAGNFIGLARTGGATDLGAGGNGLEISSSDGNQIGPGNRIAYNGVLANPVFRHGVRIDHSSGNRIVANSIHSNTGKGISLNSSNQTAPTPTIAATTFGAQTRVDVAVTGAPPGAAYFMELFTNSTCTPDGEGEFFSGFVNFTPDADGEQAVYMGAVAPGTLLTVTLTHIFTSDTSEFSNCATVADGGNQQAGPTFTVNVSTDTLTPADAGCTTAECTLREAIIAANGAPGLNTIVFDFAGVQIPLVTALPDITDPVVIDASTQLSGVQIDGTGAGAADGFVLAPGSGGSTIRHLTIQDFTLTDEAGIRILSAGNTIEGNFIHNVHDGVFLTGAGAANNVVGGSFAGGAGNVIWDFDERGVELASAGTGNRISGNVIGIDPVAEPAGGFAAIAVFGTTGTVIGADVGPEGPANPDLGNVAVGSGAGIVLATGSTGTTITSNFVGVHRTPTDGVGNIADGILILGAPDNRVGPGNTISENGDAGVEVNGEGATGNRITRNSIHTNGGDGISLVGGGNIGIGPPTVFGATLEGGTTTIEGDHSGLPDRDYFIEVFSNTVCEGSVGEGETFLGSFVFTPTLEGEDFSIQIEGLSAGARLTTTITDESNNTSEFSNCVTVSDEAPPPAPVLFGAVVDATPGTLGVAGLVDTREPLANQSLDVAFYSVPACDPIAPKTSLGVGQNFLTNPTGIAGFAKDGLTNVPIGTIVVATATRGGSTSMISNCVVADFNNTSWHTARALAPTDSKTGALRASGEGRWFKVPILPNSRVNVDVTNLPADYDLIAFSDIQQAYQRVVGTNVDPQIGPNLAITDLQREGAETQNDVFNTSQYDSSSWDPTNWDPSLNSAVFSASQWSASQWSPSQWSASQWSASQWSASQWSASQWSASQWSASQWSASQWSASQWSPSQWSSSNPSDPRAFTSAQTASLLAVSARPGTGDESVSVNTWNNTGDFYFRVQGKNGSFDPDTEFSISVSRQGSLCQGIVDQSSTPTAPAGLGTPKTLILTDSRRLNLNTVVGGSTLNSRLTTLKNRPDVGGVVVDVDADLTVRSLNAQADLPANTGCPFAKNLVASAIKRIVSAYRKAYPSIQYAVVVGDDTVIPFFRYPDPALMANETMYVPPVRDDTTSQAALRRGYILSDDFFASSTTVLRGGKQLPVPDLSLGRLVETPQDIAGMLDAYLGTTGGVVPTPTTSLTTGYGHLTDAADQIAGQLSAGIGGTGNRTLITEQTISPGVTTPPNAAPTRNTSWTADNLRSALLGPSRNDLVFLAGHFSANDALAADYKTNILTTELTAAPTNFVNAIVFSAGCHTGYNIVNGHATTGTEPLDWAQAFAQKRATLISGTGYQYGDTDFLAHGERIYAEFARQLRVTTQVAPGGAPLPEAVAVGRALLRAKQIFLKETPGLTSLDEKSLLQTTLFGLPMLSVNMPQGRIVEPPKQSIVTTTQPVGPGPGQTLGLKFKEVQLGATLTAPPPKQLKEGGATPLPPTGPLATWLEGPNGVAVRPTQPILPLQSFDVTSPDPNSALRGVGFRSGTYVDTGGTTPLTAAPATELRGIHAPFFTDVFFPTQPWSVNYFDALAGGQTLLHMTPVQHRSESPTMTRREFSNIGLQLFYSGNVSSYCPGPVPLVAVPPACVDPLVAVTPALAAPPTISGVETSFNGATDVLTFRARVVGDPAAGIQAVWVTWTIPPGLGQVGQWAPVDLTRGPNDDALWTGVLQLDPDVDPGDVHFDVWALNGVGRVTVDNNVGAFYQPGSIPGNATTPPGPPPAASQLTFTTPPPPPPASVMYGKSFQVTVELTSAGAPLADRLVSIGIGANGIPVETDANGHATIELQASRAPGSYDVTASFAGDATHAFADASEPIDIVPRPTTLTLGGTLGGTAVVGATAVHAILQATNPSTPLHQRSVFVIFKGTGPTNTTVTRVFSGKTDPQGRTDVTSAFFSALPVGNYNVDAYFNGVNVPGVLVLPPDSPEYAPSTAHATLGLRWPFSGFFSPVANPPALTQVNAGSTIPVKFGLGGNRGLAIFAAGYPQFTPINCTTKAPTGASQPATPNRPLQYDAVLQRYTFEWRTPKSFANTCQQLTLRFVDGSSDRFAFFRFVK